MHTCHVTSTRVCDWLQLHHVMLQPGEMVWYESAKLLHGRSQPLNGTRLVADSNIGRKKEKDKFINEFPRFENLFVHYMPLSAHKGHWYKSGEMRQ